LIAVIPKSYFINAGADCRHGLPIIRRIAVLHPADLRASLFPGRFWEISKIIE
jgi:hypothetical protein